MAEGNPLFIAKENHSAVTYFVLTTTDAVNTFNIRSQLAYATDYAGIALEKSSSRPSRAGKLTDENLVQQPAIAEAAKSVITMGPLAGLGIYNIGDDYYDAYLNYKQTKACHRPAESGKSLNNAPYEIEKNISVFCIGCLYPAGRV